MTPVRASRARPRGRAGKMRNLLAPEVSPPTKGRMFFHWPTIRLIEHSLYSRLSWSPLDARSSCPPWRPLPSAVRALVAAFMMSGMGSGERNSRAVRSGTSPSGVGELVFSTFSATAGGASARPSSSLWSSSSFIPSTSLRALRAWRPRCRRFRGWSMWQYMQASPWLHATKEWQWKAHGLHESGWPALPMLICSGAAWVSVSKSLSLAQ
mmetsp:Transcript_48227/g.127369  ORF Transcript_48227/g.127369 Transcript_48227/m.127369 type:complete len:210 (+) Transcript_48227:158-787(+)